MNQEQKKFTFKQKQTEYKKMTELGKKCIESLHTYFVEFPIKIREKKEYSFDFVCFGLNFGICIENSSYSIDFAQGKIVCYLIIEEQENIEVLHYTFDSLGNVNRGYFVDQFPELYLIDFYEKLDLILEEKKLIIPLIDE